MKKTIFRTLTVVIVSFFAIVLLSAVLTFAGVISVGVSPIFHYKLNDAENTVLERALLNLHENISAGQFEKIQIERDGNPIPEKQIVLEMKKVADSYGDAHSSEFFRAGPPERAEKYFPKLKGTLYTLFYFTKAQKGEFSEDVEWVITDDGELKIRNYSGGEILDWQKRTREYERKINEKFPNEIEIPFGVRNIEIRY